VDTFEEEPEIDIKAVAKEIKQLTKNEVTIKSQIGSFCEELSIEKPF